MKTTHPNWKLVFSALLGGIIVLVAVATGYWMGTKVEQEDGPILPPAWAATSASSDTMAIATGQVSEDAEGVFFLDFLTGELQGLVYYPRIGTFGARYAINVNQHLGAAGKNNKYLLATGSIVLPGVSSPTRPGGCLVYVVNLNTGIFAAYAVPWTPTAEGASLPQGGPLVYVGGGPIRNFQLPAQPNKQPAGIVDPKKQQGQQKK